MSTRATVWLKKESTGDERFLYHHCDGYSLEDDLDEVLKSLPPNPTYWDVSGLAFKIIEKDEAYGHHNVNDIGWDSEYVYVIDLDKRTLTKYNCGLCFDKQGAMRDIKTQDKYIERKFEYLSPYEVPENPKEAEIEKYATGIIQLIENFDWDADIKKGIAQRIYDKYK